MFYCCSFAFVVLPFSQFAGRLDGRGEGAGFSNTTFAETITSGFSQHYDFLDVALLLHYYFIITSLLLHYHFIITSLLLH